MQCLLRRPSFCLPRLLLIKFRAASTDTPVILRPYQEKCLEACIRALESGSTRIGVSLPTGSGKTTVFITLLSRIPPPVSNPAATRALIIVNSVELARQSAEQVARLFPQWSVEIEQATKNKATGLADVTVGTYQTLKKTARLAKFDPRTLKAIIVDEAHHAAAPSYRHLLSHFDTNIKNPDLFFKAPELTHKIPIIGFSATFSRHDGLALGSVFERIVYHRAFLEMIKEQWLCDVRFTTVRAQINLKDVTLNTRTGDFNPTSLAHVINTDTINDLIVKAWIDRASTRRSTLVFCVNIDHTVALTQAFRGYGVDARCISSETPAALRRDLLALFKAGKYPVLLNCAILTEGADIPNIDCIIVARPTRSRNVFAQMIGRGMRLSPETGKTDCHIIDFVESATRVTGVMSIPSLFGLDPVEIDIENETLEALEERATNFLVPSQNPNIPQPTTITYFDHDDPFSYLTSGGSPHIITMSPNAWVACGDDIYVLECFGKGVIRIQPGDNEGPHFTAHFNPSSSWVFQKSPYLRSRKIVTAQTLLEAVQGCDTYASANVVKGPLAMSLRRTAKWRRAPATEKQKKLVQQRWQGKSGSGHSLDENLIGRIKRLTKGEAADVIIRLKHGAMSRIHKKVKESKKKLLAVNKERLRQAREIVQVGPLTDTEL